MRTSAKIIIGVIVASALFAIVFFELYFNMDYGPGPHMSFQKVLAFDGVSYSNHGNSTIVFVHSLGANVTLANAVIQDNSGHNVTTFKIADSISAQYTFIHLDKILIPGNYTVMLVSNVGDKFVSPSFWVK